VRAGQRVRRMFEAHRPSLVFHLAAYKHVPWGEEDAEAFVDANVLGARAVIEAACAVGTERIVYPSTDKAIDPPSLYGATKRLVELMLYASAATGGPRCSIARFVNVLGSRGSAPETFARQLAHGQALSVTDAAMRRYWITPSHARLLLLHAACIDENAMTVTPDAGEEIPVVEIARRMTRALAPTDGEPQVAITGTRPGERLSEPIVAAHERLESLPLPGIWAVRGGVAADAGAVGASVDRLAALVGSGATNEALRGAVFQEIRALQSRH
ncbi:MAG TPA: polysaccharide biosynthesis protein, partial [Chloroflexota bacterium]|nr:polysaccharide biosynthesis protein [Chloroflexota bacterium]